MRTKLMILAGVMLPLTAMAAPDPQLLALRQQVAALQLDHALALTQQQAQALLPLLQDAKAQATAMRNQRAASEPALATALAQAVADLKSTGTVSDSTAQAVNAARGTPGTLRQNLRSLWQQARQILTPDQLQALKTVRLGIAGPASSAAGPRPSHRGFMRFRLAHVALSDAFIALVQARGA